MPKIKSVGSEAGLFVFNDLEYNKGLFKIYYNNVQLDESGVPDLNIIKVGIKYLDRDETLAPPAVFSDWINGDTLVAFASYSDLVTYLSQSLSVDYSKGGGFATEATLAQIELNTDASGVYSHEEITTTTPQVYNTGTYKKVEFVVEEGSVNVNDGTNDIVYTSNDKSIGYSFDDNKGIAQTITLTLAASSRVRVVTVTL